MDIGLLIPQGYFNEFDGWNPIDAWERIVEIALLGERLGFQSLWTGEHVLPKWDQRSIAFDCVTLSTGLAALTTRPEIGFVVLNTTFRNAAMTAKMAGTLDTISKGRLVLGLGAGFKESEALAVGVPFPSAKSRLQVLGEHLEVIRKLTREGDDLVEYEGDHVAVNGSANEPRTGARDHIPILIGGHGKQITFRLAARYADEINIDVAPSDLPEFRKVLHDRCEEVGRDPGSLRIAAGLNPAWPYRDLEFTGQQQMMRPEDIPAVMDIEVDATASRAEEIAQWRELGIDRLVCGAPGLADSDEPVFELVEHLRLAGAPLGAAPQD